jgi:5'-nucleotidase
MPQFPSGGGLSVWENALPHILLTNDDGVHSLGLLALRRALSSVADVSVLAPDHNWSAAGHTKTMHKPLRVRETTLADGSPALTTTGAPSDCVGLARLGLVPQRPDLVISGINAGANLGQDVTYSGTVAAAMEAVLNGLPAIAVSLDLNEHTGEADFEPAARVAAWLAGQVLECGLPAESFLNVNLPRRSMAELKGVRVTRLGRRVYRDLLLVRHDPRGRPYYWLGGELSSGELKEGTDLWAIAHGYISVTPVQMDMTAYSLLEVVRGWGLEEEEQPWISGTS